MNLKLKQLIITIDLTVKRKRTTIKTVLLMLIFFGCATINIQELKRSFDEKIHPDVVDIAGVKNKIFSVKKFRKVNNNPSNRL